MIERWDDEIPAPAQTRFCIGCGMARPEGAAFCPSCGRSFGGVSAATGATAPAVPPTLDSTAPSRSSTAQMAGIAWLITAALTGYLAFEQWSIASVLGRPAGDLSGIAFVNGVAALATAYFGARCLQKPSRGQLTNAAAWGALSVLSGVYQASQGASYGVFLLSIVGAGIAGVLSYVARAEVPR